MDIIWKRLQTKIAMNPDAMKAQVDKLWEKEYGNIDKFNEEQERKHNARLND